MRLEVLPKFRGEKAKEKQAMRLRKNNQQCGREIIMTSVLVAKCSKFPRGEGHQLELLLKSQFINNEFQQ